MVDGQLLLNLRRGVLEYCVLGLLTTGEAYGYDIARRLMADGTLLDGEGTLYPLLNRLRRAGLVTASWVESPAGPPRKYYRISPTGRSALRTFREFWPQFTAAVDDAIGGQS